VRLVRSNSIPEPESPAGGIFYRTPWSGEWGCRPIAEGPTGERSELAGGPTPVPRQGSGADGLEEIRGWVFVMRAARSARPEGPAPTPHARRACRSGRPAAARSAAALIAAKNASLKELMARMGHSSTRAALIYQHRSQERDREIAADLGKAFKSRVRARRRRHRARNGHGSEKTR
jgi:hypothetical protein